MSGKDIERANYLKRLFHEMMAKVDHSNPHNKRQKDAEAKMDEKLGKEWREHAKVDQPPVHQDSDNDILFVRMAEVGDEEGLGYKGTEAPEDEDKTSCSRENKVAKIISMLKDLV